MLLALAGMVVAPGVSSASTIYNETTGGETHSWSNYTNAGGTAGPVYGGSTTLPIDCVEQSGFTVQDGNRNWYHIAGTSFYASADAFYNNGATSGSLHGTPYVDPAVPTCESLPRPASGVNETAGGVASTWTNPANAGGSQGPSIAAHQTLLISCKLVAFKVLDGNTWWYQIGAAPWSNQYYVSADAFYNNGETSGSLAGTPFVDNAVPTCAPGTGAGGGGTNGGSGGGTSGSGGTTGSGGSSSTGGPTPGTTTSSKKYNRSAAQQWALANVYTSPRYSEDCTWYASQALWKGGMPKDYVWTDSTFTDKASPHNPLPGPSRTAAYAPALISYLVFGKHLAAWRPLPWSQNAIPDARIGDLIAYDWNDDGLIDHIMVVTDIESGSRVYVSGHTNPTKNAYWSWSTAYNGWIQYKYPKPVAYLVHITF